MPMQPKLPLKKTIVALADQALSQNQSYLNSKNASVTISSAIPDGSVIDTTRPDEPKLFVVENILLVTIHLSMLQSKCIKFVTSFVEGQRAVRAFFITKLGKSQILLKRLENACKQSSSPNIDHYLDRAVYSDFRGLVIIDEETSELNRVLEKINANISVLQLKAFISNSGERIFQFDTLYDELEEARPKLNLTDSNSNTPEDRGCTSIPS